MYRSFVNVYSSTRYVHRSTYDVTYIDASTSHLFVIFVDLGMWAKRGSVDIDATFTNHYGLVHLSSIYTFSNMVLSHSIHIMFSSGLKLMMSNNLVPTLVQTFCILHS